MTTGGTGSGSESGSGSGDGWRIGRYRVDGVLGTGAFATVYRAVDERLEDTVAVKVLAENHSLDPEIRTRFLTEGRVLRRVTSPHVVGVHDLGETDRQQPYLVLEYATRGTLSQRAQALRSQGWRPGAGDLLAVAEPLARALDAVHRAGVVHRDVNPGNVLLTHRGQVDRPRPATLVQPDERFVLADLGLCKDLALNSGHTSAGGTEGFRPPELRGGPAVIDARADLWSLSALLVWVATGSAPDGLTLDRGWSPAMFAAMTMGLPPQLGAALDRSLAYDPAARHPDALAWLSDITAALTAQRPAPGPPAPPLAPPMQDARPHATPAESRSDWGWKLRHSLWIIAALPLGLTTWIGFLYIGLKANRTSWLWWAAVYGAAAVLILVMAAVGPTDARGDAEMGAWQNALGVTTMVATWLGGFVHALVANGRWLAWRAAFPWR